MSEPGVETRNLAVELDVDHDWLITYVEGLVSVFGLASVVHHAEPILDSISMRLYVKAWVARSIRGHARANVN